MSGPIYRRIQTKLQTLQPILLRIEDNSASHAGHAAMKGIVAKETHFSVEVVSDEFSGMSLVKRHRRIYSLLDDEFKDGLHALQISAKTGAEV